MEVFAQGSRDMTSMKKLSPEDARRALYIDFEGNKDKPPALLGCTRRSSVQSKLSVWQAITDPTFGSLATADELELLTLADAVERILQRAERKHRRIVAWSTHEHDVIRKHCPEHLERFELLFLNAKLLAERWRSKCHAGNRPSTNKLAAYFELIGYQVPERAGPGQVGDTLKSLSKSFSLGKTASDLTENQSRRWADLRDHNRHDCTGMRQICILAADEIAAAS